MDHWITGSERTSVQNCPNVHPSKLASANESPTRRLTMLNDMSLMRDTSANLKRKQWQFFNKLLSVVVIVKQEEIHLSPPPNLIAQSTYMTVLTCACCNCPAQAKIQAEAQHTELAGGIQEAGPEML